MNAIRNIVDAILYPFRMLAQIPSSVVSSPRRMLGLSLPVRAALLLFFMLLLITVGWALLAWSMSEKQPLWDFFGSQLPAILLLDLLIPVIVWYALKLWLEGEPSPHPEIDAVWNQACKAMADHSIDMSETPIFLIVGPPDFQASQRLMNASNISFSVCVPTGPGAAHVYANTDGIFVVCSGSSCLGTLLGGRSVAAGAAEGVPAPASGGFDPTRTMAAGDALGSFGGGAANTPGFMDDSDAAGGFAQTQVFAGPFTPGGSPAGGQGGVAGTPPPNIRAHATGPPSPGPASTGSASPGSASPGPASPGPASPGVDAIRGTMDLSGFGNPGGPAASATGSGPLGPPAPRLDTVTVAVATSRLAYLCRCIRRVREPLCPVNGILVTTPFQWLAGDDEQAATQMQVALTADLATMRSATRVRCGVTHLISGMEDEPGFRELIRRVGADRVQSQRFGKGVGLWNVPTKNLLDAVVKHACGAFEDWSYLLFREEAGLGKRGNRHLYGLLCRVRSTFTPRLTNLIQSAYAIRTDDAKGSQREPFLFSGCYFAATGTERDSQAFLSSVFRKLQTEEEELEWGGEAIDEENRMQAGVQILLILSGVLIAILVAMLIYRFQFS